MNFKQFLLTAVLCVFGITSVLSADAAGFFPENAESTQYLNSSLSVYKERGHYGLYDSNGYVTKAIYNNIEAFPNNNNYVKIYKYSRCGAMDSNGKIIIAPIYDDITMLDKDMFGVKLFGNWGIVDSFGDTIVSTDYDEIEYFYEDLYKLSKYGKYGVVNKFGSIVISLEWDSLEFLTTDFYKVSRSGKYGIVNSSGHIDIQPNYGHIELLNSGFSVCMNNSSACGILNSKEEVVIPLNYNGIIKNLANGYFTVNCSGKYGVIDIDNNVILDCKYSKITKGNESVIYIQNNKLVGLADIKDGRIIAPPVYTKIQPVSQKGYYKVKQNGKWGVINHDGKIVEAVQYGPLKINSVVKSIPKNSVYEKLYSYNSYYACISNLKYMLKTGGNVIKDFKKVFSSSNPYSDIKNEATNLMKQYSVDGTYRYKY